MRRVLSVLVGLALACGLVVAAPAGTALSETAIYFTMPVDEGPAPASGSQVYGRSWPAKPGYTVTLWRGQVPCFCPPLSEPTARVAVATIRPDGSFRLTARFSRPDHFQMFVRVNAGGGNTVGYSPYFNVQVR